MSSADVSVVMALRNGARFVAEALDSVLAQRPAVLEVVVVDGGSDDGSPAIAASYPGVRVIGQRGSGFQGAWNEGIEAAHGDLIAIIDSDDLWLEGKLAAQLAALDGPPRRDWCFTHGSFFLEPGHEVPAGFRPELIDSERPLQVPSAMLVRRSVFERLGGYRDDLEMTADVEWHARVQRALGPPAMVPRALVRKRVHDANLSLTRARRLNTELVALLRQNIHARR